MSHGRDTSPKPYGVVAEFETPEQLLEATKAARQAGYRDMDAYSPIPVHGVCEAMEHKDERLGWIVFAHGVLGFLVGYGLQIWTSNNFTLPFDWAGEWGLNGYAHNVGGKPLMSIPAFFPPAYELTILFAAFSAGLGMFALNKLPKPHHPVMNAACMIRASQDRFILCIEATDPRYDEAKVEEFLKTLNPLSTERVMTSEGY
ncbi:MAG: DUF3341 domain-containing protein [Fimbriimonadaceae bacterium]|jgi:hypothetical protein|nr:DUF3341 domain-containing protein [Fimbriimonadaceae bacterium]